MQQHLLVSRQAWTGVLKSATSLLNTFCGNFAKKKFHVVVARFTVALKVCSRSLCQMTEMHEYMKAVMAKHWSVVYTFRILHWPKINQGQVLCNLFERSVGKVPPDSCSYVFRWNFKGEKNEGIFSQTRLTWHSVEKCPSQREEQHVLQRVYNSMFYNAFSIPKMQSMINWFRNNRNWWSKVNNYGTFYSF